MRDSFLGSILSTVEIIPDSTIETASTDGLNVYYNENFFNTLNKNDRTFIFAHEVAHIALKHSQRAKQLNISQTDLMLWNIASDYVINYELVTNGFILPEMALKTPEKYYGLDTDTIYNDLKKRYRKHKEIPESVIIDIIPRDIDTDAMLKDCMNVIPVKNNKSISRHNEEIKRIASTYYKNETPWETILRNFYSSFNRDSFSYYKPSRRSEEFYLPSRCAEDYDLKIVNAYVDCSLSISDELFSKFIYELKYIFINLNLEKMVIKTFSTKINDTFVFTDSCNIEAVKTFSNRGTSIKGVIKDINNTNSMFSIIFTDGEFETKYIDDYTKDNNQLVWVIYKNKKFIPKKGFLINIPEI